jgi:hypothetical protein
MTMTFIDKTEYINNDFRNSSLIALGDMPGTRSGADEYFDKAIKAASAFLLRYRGKGRMIEHYAYILTADFMESIEREYKRKFGKGGKA